jgi:transposase
VRGYDGGKKIKGRKRHAMVDTDGRALKLQAHSAAIQDRDGAGPLLRASRNRWPFVRLGYADAGYQGPRVTAASPIRIEIVRKPEGQVGFAVHAKRWVVERSSMSLHSLETCDLLIPESPMACTSSSTRRVDTPPIQAS